jgi:hypothetical protein
MRKVHAIQNAIVQWRSNKKSKNDRMPETLRREICALASRIGVVATCRKLSIQRGLIKSGSRPKRGRFSTLVKHRSSHKGELVEVQMPQWPSSRVRMSNRFGEAIEFELPQAEVGKLVVGFFRGGAT